MNFSFARIAFIAGVIFSTTAAQADERILLPDGRGCWRNSAGFVHGCDPAPQNIGGGGGGGGGGSCMWTTKKEWDSCERKKDWPGQPSNCNHFLPRC